MKKDGAQDNSLVVNSERRSLALALLGAFGGASVLSACGDEDSPQGVMRAASDNASSALQYSGTINWFDKVLGTSGSDPGLRDYTGSTDEVAILTGYRVSADGGGGMFVWSDDSLPDDDGIAINPLGGTNPGWRRIYAGAANPRWFGITGDDSSGDRARIAAALANASLRNTELNVQDFGILPDGSDVSVRVNFLIGAASGIHTSGEEAIIKLYFPAGDRSYWFESPIIPPNGNHRRLYIRGDGWYSAAVSNGTFWSYEKMFGGSCLQAALNVDLIYMAPASNTGAEMYRDLYLSDIALQGSGYGTTGDLVGMHGFIESVDAMGGRVTMHNVTLGGGRTAIRIASSQQCEFHQVSIVGCEVGFQLGDNAEHTGSWVSSCYGLQIQGCDTAIVVHSATGFAIYGGLIQGNTTNMHFVDGASWNNILIDRVHLESYTNIFTWAGMPSSSGGFEVSRCRFSSAGNIEIFGNGWSFSNCAMGGVSLACSTGQSGILLNNSNPDAGVTAPDMELSRIGSRSSLSALSKTYWNQSSNVNIDFAQGGTCHVLSLVGNTSITLPDPTTVPAGTILQIHVIVVQIYTVNISWVNATVSWSDVGQTYAAASSIQFQQAAHPTGAKWYQLTSQSPWST